jgi:hypothetical protein
MRDDDHFFNFGVGDGCWLGKGPGAGKRQPENGQRAKTVSKAIGHRLS